MMRDGTFSAAARTVIAVGASTGGTEAIKQFLCRIPAGAPPILIAQHMPENFTRAFAERLDRLCAVRVSEACDGASLAVGHAYVAPGHSHLLLERRADGYAIRLSQAPAFNRHRPSVDVLFDCVAREAGTHAIGVLLTGMGKDGAAGLLALKRAGAYTFAQDEASCVVFGMPKEAIALGGVDEVVPLGQLAERVLTVVSARQGAAAPGLKNGWPPAVNTFENQR